MKFIVVLLALAYASSASTVVLDGRALRERCQTTAARADQGFCSGYLMATADTLSNVRRYYKRKVFNICLPQSAAPDASELVRLFLDWTRRNADKLHHSANEIAIAALHEIYRCGRR
jgi:hypothetical protein